MNLIPLIPNTGEKVDPTYFEGIILWIYERDAAVLEQNWTTYVKTETNKFAGRGTLKHVKCYSLM